MAIPTKAIAHIQNTAPGPPSVIATATPATLPPPTRPPTETSSASRPEMAFGSPVSLFPEMTRNMRPKNSNCTKPVMTVMNKPRTTRIGISDQPHVKSPITPNRFSMSVTFFSS